MIVACASGEVLDLDVYRLAVADRLFGQARLARTHRAFEDYKSNASRALGCQPLLKRDKHICRLAPDDGLRFQRHQANRSEPLCVKRTKVPLSWIVSQPRSIASERPAAYSHRRALVSEQKRAVDFLDTDTAILHRLEGPCVLHHAAFSASANGRSLMNFMPLPCLPCPRRA